MNSRRKRIKKDVFSNEDALPLTGENKPKTLMWAKVFCFDSFKMKTRLFLRDKRISVVRALKNAMAFLVIYFSVNLPVKSCED